MVIAYFTPGFGALGGALIGGSAAILLLFCGEILGASGLVSSTGLYPRKALTDPGVAWKLFLIAIFMLVSNVVLAQFFHEDNRLFNDPSIPIVSMAGYLIGGFFVGFGTRLGNGCTTGHGICGMARLSKRSFSAVATFMLSAIATANVVAPDNKALAEYTAFLRTDQSFELFNQGIGLAVVVPIVLAAAYALFNLRRSYQLISTDAEAKVAPVEGSTELHVVHHHDEEAADPTKQQEASADTTEQIASDSVVEVEPKFTANKKMPNRNERVNIMDGVSKLKPAAMAGVTFSTGLALSGMVKPSKIIGFLNLFLLEKGTWDPTLIMVMAGGSIVSWISYQFVSGHGIVQNSYAMECPRRSSGFSIPTNKNIDGQLLIGSLCFGIGWGVAGLCPGPAMFLAASGTIPILAFWWPTFFLGALLAQKIKDRS
ncbi:unnamed protein product [Cylindrotheca closterium]|uniref:Sulphur transport domain-containing protein n=1 Tax=Cylindrotheca closterium TaxID=2856 RepID=A0AAD2CLW5_9STRA|nr:unnamed protein product [Cylindrotheca closterium]